MKNTDCGRYEDLIFAYAEGGLTPEERAEFEAHISGCGDCSRKLAEARRLLSDIQASRYHAPAELLPDVMAAVGREKARENSDARRTRMIRRIASVAAALVLTVGVAVSVRMFGGKDSGVKSAEDYSANLPGDLFVPEKADEDARQESDLSKSGDAAVPSVGMPDAEPSASGAKDGQYSEAPDREEDVNNRADIPSDELAGGSESDGAAIDDYLLDNKAGSAYDLPKETDPGAALMKYGAAYLITQISG